MSTIPVQHTYDEVHVISDLHMGGEDPLRVFDQAKALEWLINDLRCREAERLALVINGDMVDFLIEKGATEFDPDGAIDKLNRIVQDDNFSPVWEALKNFVQKEGRELAITLGNHDLELALPWVRERLLTILTGEEDEKDQAKILAIRNRIHLAFEGHGFLCEVGSKRILCTHGNEVDRWNVTDYEGLRRQGLAKLWGMEPEDWMPSVGSRLVVQVFNKIKKGFVFINLLKPEVKQGTGPILLALDPASFRKLVGTFLRSGGRRLAQERPRWPFLGEEDGDSVGKEIHEEVGGAEGLGYELLSSVYRSEMGETQGGKDTGRELLWRIEEERRQGDHPSSLDYIGDGQVAELLGYSDLIPAFMFRLSDEKRFDRAIVGLETDPSFDLQHQNKDFLEIDARVGREVDVLITGHTHLRRRLSREGAAGTYFNTGTWIPLIQITREILEDRSLRPALHDIFKAENMNQLEFCLCQQGEKFPALKDLLQRLPTVASIVKESDGVDEKLMGVEVKDTDSNSFDLKEVIS